MHEAVFLVLIALHLLAATTWVGGVLFFMFAVVPAARARPASGIPEVLGRAFRPVAYGALGTLIITGPLLLFWAGIGPHMLVRPRFWTSAFGATLALKAACVLLVLILTVWHDAVLGPRAARGGPVRAARLAARAIGLLSIAILLAGLLLAQGL
ncbi:hypothetical protein [Acidiferrobacter sp.]|uniref:hypothetical protein n=1 Tax=Acidiferrobacter sp. TaxID=1872107 RepID=UPI0026329132|nr:hypothetical protein [Acidiferrobacter sp.]